MAQKVVLMFLITFTFDLIGKKLTYLENLQKSYVLFDVT